MGIDIGDAGFFPIYRYQPELPIGQSLRARPIDLHAAA